MTDDGRPMAGDESDHASPFGQPSSAVPFPPVKIKVCGLTVVDEALACAEAGADWIGLNFHPASPRSIGIETAREIIAALPVGVEAVGVFVDRPPEEVIETARRTGLSIAQLHGDEPPEAVLEAKLAGLRVVKAFRLRDPHSLIRMAIWRRSAEVLDPRSVPDATLVDAFAAEQAGGTGKTIASELLARLAAPGCEDSGEFAVFGGRPANLILAGGLTPANVASRVRQVRPWMVDVASGVESAPGRKDVALVRAFVRSARSVRD